MHIVHIVHILDKQKSLSGFLSFIATTAWSPIPGPSCSRTTTYNHHHCSLIYRRKLRESQPILVAWQRLLSLLHPQEQKEGVPLLRILESHTRLVLVHGVRWRLQIRTDPARLRSINKSKYAKYAKYAKYDLVSVGPCTLPALKHRRTCGSTVVLHASVCLCMDFEQEQKFAEPYVIHPELESSIRYPGWDPGDWSAAISLAQMATMRHACDSCALHDRSGVWSTGQCDHSSCWTDEYAECLAGPDSVQHILD